MSLQDASFWFLERLERDGEMTAENVREFLRDINHYSREPWEPHARSRALKDAAKEFLSRVEDTSPDHWDKEWSISWAGGWLRSLAEVHADEWFHFKHPNMHPPFVMRQRQWDDYRGGIWGATPCEKTIHFIGDVEKV